jgi:hypothetical protein
MTVRQRHALTALAFLVVACVLVGIQARHHDELAAPGETSQLDYVLTLPHVPATGDRVAPETAPGTAEADLPFSTSGSTPPAYYVATAVIARPVAAVTGWSPLSVARWTGVLWLWLFLLVTFRLARLVGAPRATAAGVATFVAASTSLSTLAAYVGPDVAGAAAGGLVLVTAWRHDGSRRALLLLAGVCLLAGLTKLTLAAPVAAAALMLVLRPLLTRRSPRPLQVGPGLLAAVVAVVAFLVPAVGWVLRARATAHVSAATLDAYAGYVTDHVDWGAYHDSVLYPWLNPVGSSFAQATLTDPTDGVIGLVLLALLSLGMLTAALAVQRPRVAALGAGLLVVTIAGPAVFLQTDVWMNNLAMPIEQRHALGLLPGSTACAAWLLRDRGGAVAIVIACGWALFNLLT